MAAGQMRTPLHLKAWVWVIAGLVAGCVIPVDPWGLLSR